MADSLYTKRVFLQLVYSRPLHDKLNDNGDRSLQDELMDFKAESGRRLKQARDAKGLKLRELAAMVNGVSESRISNYEQGTRLMRQPEAVKLAEALGVSAAYLMCVDETLILPAKVKRLVELYEQSDLRGKRTIEQAAEAQAAMNVRSIPHLSAVQSM